MDRLTKKQREQSLDVLFSPSKAAKKTQEKRSGIFMTVTLVIAIGVVVLLETNFFATPVMAKESIDQNQVILTELQETINGLEDELIDKQRIINEYETSLRRIEDNIINQKVEKEVESEKNLKDAQMQYIRTIAEMDSTRAAGVISGLLDKDKELVKTILTNIHTEEKSQILDSLSSEQAVEIMQLLASDN